MVDELFIFPFYLPNSRLNEVKKKVHDAKTEVCVVLCNLSFLKNDVEPHVLFFFFSF